MNEKTGEIDAPELNKVIHVVTKRANGTFRHQQDFKYCPTRAEQHAAQSTDLNYLMERLKPDELAAYISARAARKQEIIGHDFSTEPNPQQARNIVYLLKKSFDNLPDEIKKNFKNHVEFLKFIDNPANQEKMIQLGLMTKTEIQQHTAPQITNEQTQTNETQEEPKTTKTKTKTEAKS